MTHRCNALTAGSVLHVKGTEGSRAATPSRFSVRIAQDAAAIPRRSTSVSCLFAEMACAQLFLPQHSAVAAARLTSCPSVNSRSCRALSEDGSQASLWHVVGAQDPMVKEAAEIAVKIIQQRSNSLMPYELQEIVSAKKKVVNVLNIFDLLLKIKWENEVKSYEVEMKRTLEGKWTMNHMEPDAGH